MVFFFRINFMNESQLLSAQMRRKVTQNKWNSQIFTQIFSFLSSWKNKRNLSLTLRLDLFSKSENSFFQVRKQFFPSQKRTFSKSEKNVFEVRKRPEKPSTPPTLSINVLRNHAVARKIIGARSF